MSVIRVCDRMRSVAKTVTFKFTVGLKQPEVGKLIRKLRQLTQLSQVEKKVEAKWKI